MLSDNFGRIHDYLRLSLTDRCNLRCVYCYPDNLTDCNAKSLPLTVDEIVYMVSVFVKEGIKKIRLTGGEPMLRKEFCEIIERLSVFPVELVITTNGIYIREYLDELKQAGIHSVNVSLDTVNREKYKRITGFDFFDKVWENINLLVQHGFHVKVNMVVMKGINEDEIPAFVDWTKHQPVHVRFIEYMPFEGNQWSFDSFISYKKMLEIIASKYEFVPLPNAKNDTAKKFSIPGYTGTFAFISTMTDSFCSGCNRLRLTADGKLKNCLFSKDEADLAKALRKGEDILPLIIQSINGKEEALGGQFTFSDNTIGISKINNRSMIDIGG
jgi:cyclic pyranopterin phosphate synthase